MPDNDLYTLVRDEFEPVRMRRGLHDVTTRGRELRRRRRATGTVAAAGLAVALAAAALVPTLHTEPPAPLQLAAWSVDARPGGTVVVTIRQLTHAEELTAALTKAGVPALVEFKRIPTAGTRRVGCANQQPTLPQLDNVMPAQDQHSGGPERVLTIRPRAMPAGASLHFVIFDAVNDRGASVQSVRISLVHGNPLPCLTD